MMKVLKDNRLRKNKKKKKQKEQQNKKKILKNSCEAKDY
jgi:hypothetical protein